MTLRPWIFLLAAVATEIVGVSVMKLVSQETAWTALLFMYLMIGLSFFLLATAMEHIPMAVTYATWETLGLAAVAFIGWQFFGESLGALKLLGMALLMAGVVLVNAGGHAAKE
ncbi:DMT family transporter [Comamonas endophytica]|uniref:Spermidine export protein MdtJ n=1 Tax=Comamonas endophytica TaxID=2949090 RepID=A0ABY6GFG0_9BURK|nr:MULTISPECIES: multidrug efflux SMR transporter [unclassified Acidovorax]MCD2513384.1 multidrug efflux SMR transporter [Acidovorax sp. D4N7]UYG53833.1 multidrug efflux SMR transporter [Acidovorax sp. 5MLIR]